MGDTSLKLHGHAGAAPYGQDLVCAGVSALVYALAQRLQELEQKGALEAPPNIQLGSGEAQISAVAKGGYEAEVAEDFRLIESGLKFLETHYPERISLVRSIGI
jgi:uncharacterized protein YsxB (DUF464 family)